MHTPGQILAGRYIIERHAGTGGMGSVFRALDQQSGRPVALKLLHYIGGGAAGRPEVERFLREARILSELRHPAIVGYIDHGLAEDGQAYLAMDWLDGHDLAARLQDGPLSLTESIVLITKVAEALCIAHQRGIVHRDIKPANLLLRKGNVDRVAVLDFGIARKGIAATRRMTQTGYLVGTPEYMAPEQARGESLLTPAADVFALGCVWFECLTGWPPFRSEHLAAVLAKVLFEPAPSLHQIRPGFPKEISALIADMLDKEPRQRPADASALLDCLASLGKAELTSGAHLPLAVTDAGAPINPESEQRLVTVLLCSAPIVELGPTVALAEHSDLEARLNSLRVALAPLGARVQPLADGSIVVTLAPERGEATDLAALAARGAMLLRELLPESSVALATGKAMLSGRVPVGDTFDRAAELLTRLPTSTASQRRSGIILLDELTTDLLEGRFVVERTQAGLGTLQHEYPADATRPLLGKPTPFLGREQELALLEATLSASIEESAAKAVVLIGAPGLGKSRLRHEFLRRLAARGSDGTLLFGRADPFRTGQAYALLGQAMRRLCGVHDGEPAVTAWVRIRKRCAVHIGESDCVRVSEFLAEASGYPVEDPQSPKIRAARRDPAQMSQGIRQSLVDLLRAESSVRPVLVILEDLQWGDSPTVRAIEAVLEELGDAPFMVLALARPGVEEVFPHLLHGRAVSMTLQPLSRRAGERLTQQILGRDTPPATMARIVEQSGGNPLFLEELIRAVAEGRGDNLPPTVLAILQARLGTLPQAERKILRAASVFGEVCWTGGIQALTGAQIDDVTYCLSSLVKAEFLTERRQSRFPGESEYGFRNVVAREAAYSLLTEEDRRRLHTQASSFLEAAGEEDPRILAEHLRIGGELARARELFASAAARAFRYGHLDEVLKLCDQGHSCSREVQAADPAPQTHGMLHGLEARARVFRGELAAALSAAQEALKLLEPEGAPWYEVLGSALFTAGLSEDGNAIPRLLSLAESSPPRADAKREERAAFAQVAVSAMNIYAIIAAYDAGRRLISLAEAAVAPIADEEPLARGDVLFLRAYFISRLDADPWLQRELASAAAAAFQEAENLRMVGFARLVWSEALIMLDEREPAIAMLRDVLELAKRRQERLLSLWTQVYLASALLSGAMSELPATDIAESQAITAHVLGSVGVPRLLRGIAGIRQATAERLRGNPESALRWAREGLENLRRMPAFLSRAYHELLECLAAYSEPASAKAVADQALAHLEWRGGLDFSDIELGRACAQAYRMAGTPELAQLVEAKAHTRMEILAARASARRGTVSC